MSNFSIGESEIVSLLYIAKKVSVRVAIELSDYEIALCREMQLHQLKGIVKLRLECSRVVCV